MRLAVFVVVGAGCASLGAPLIVEPDTLPPMATPPVVAATFGVLGLRRPLAGSDR